MERLHRTIRESVIKSLASKEYITEKYWGMCFHDAILKHNAIPNHNITTTTPYLEWHGKIFDLLYNPLLPFGTIVMAHIPVDEQTALSGNHLKLTM